MTNEVRDRRTECWGCRHKRSIPDSAHIQCVRPDNKIVGNPHGIRRGWFAYPLCFDPVWKVNLCQNYEADDLAYVHCDEEFDKEVEAALRGEEKRHAD